MCFQAWLRPFVSVLSILSILISNTGWANYCSEAFHEERFTLLNWEANERPNIRVNISKPRVFLDPQDSQKGQDRGSVGVLISRSHDMLEIEANLGHLLERRSKKEIEDSVIFVTGVEMGRKQEREKKEEVKRVLDRLGLTNIKVRALSIPKIKAKTIAGKVRLALQKFKYFFPSLTRDYQVPLLKEVLVALTFTAAVEVANLTFLATKGISGAMPALDVGAVIGAHLLTLGIYDTYSRMMGNWLVRKYHDNPRSFAKRFRNSMHGFFTKIQMPRMVRMFEPHGDRGFLASPEVMFLRQVMLSLPFILNYTILGNLTKIKNYVMTHPITMSFNQLMAEIPEFVATHSITTVLQTIFYKRVVTEGTEAWSLRQVGIEDVTAGRVVRKIAIAPIIALDAVALALSTQLGGEPLLSLGPMNFTWGHVALLALIWGGGKLTRQKVMKRGERRGEVVEPAYVEKVMELYKRRFGGRVAEPAGEEG